MDTISKFDRVAAEEAQWQEYLAAHETVDEAMEAYYAEMYSENPEDEFGGETDSGLSWATESEPCGKFADPSEYRLQDELESAIEELPEHTHQMTPQQLAMFTQWKFSQHQVKIFWAWKVADPEFQPYSLHPKFYRLQVTGFFPEVL